MRIPTYENQNRQVAPITEPVRGPSLDMPGAVPGAFGGNIGEAYEKLGKVGEKIAANLNQLALDAQDQQETEKETAFMQDWQSLLNDQSDETTLINGHEVSRKKGFLLRPLGQARGVTEEATLLYRQMRE